MTPERPVFIGGASGSGKTQVRMVLGAHPDLAMTRRTRLWDRFHGRFGDLADPRNLDRCLRAIVADEGAAILAPDPARIRRELAAGPVTYARIFGLLHRHHAERLGRRRWGDQLGGVERFADPIFAEFPDARMIHMVRDARADALRHGRGAWGGLGWRTAEWVASARVADRNRRRYPGRYIVVRFETLVADPRATLERLCTEIGETFVPSMERMLASIAWDRTDASRDANEARTVRSTAFVDRYAGSDLEAFDYPAARRVRLGGLDRVAFELLERPVNRLSMAARRALDAGTATRRRA